MNIQEWHKDQELSANRKSKERPIQLSKLRVIRMINALKKIAFPYHGNRQKTDFEKGQQAAFDTVIEAVKRIK